MISGLPDLVRQRANSNGAAGREWLDTLPDVVESLSAQWGLTIGATLGGGTAGYVAEATDSDGFARVLKVAMPLDMDEVEAFHRSVEAHRIARGRGCVGLLDVDDSARAMLLERLGPNLDQLGYDVDRILEAIAATLQTFWRPIDGEHSLPSGAEKAAWLAQYITSMWSELGRPCSRRVIDHAISYCDERAAAFDPARAVLVHGDAHGWNTLSDPAGSFKFVDVEGVVSEPAHDLSVAMREYNDPLLTGDTARLTRARAERLAGLCDVDPEPVWQWGFVERVSTGLANIREFDNDDGRAFLEVAERCLDHR